MRVENYTPQPTYDYNWSNIPETYSFIQELKSRNDISYDKLELFDSITDYITYYEHNSNIDYNMESRTTFIQSKNNNGNRVLVKFPIASAYREYENAADDVCAVSREEFDRRRNKYVNVGSQNYTMIYINAIVGHIIVTGDRHIFADDRTLENIATTDINKIADELHRVFVTGNYASHEKDRLIFVNNRLSSKGKGGCSFKYSGQYDMDELLGIYDYEYEDEEPTYKKKKKRKKFLGIF